MGKLPSMSYSSESTTEINLLSNIYALGGNLPPLLGSQWLLDVLIGQYGASTLQVGGGGRLHILRKIQDFMKSVKVMLQDCWTEETSLMIEKRQIQ